MIDNSCIQQRGHYQFNEILGQGGMGIVYLAEDTRLKRFVAIKCIKEEKHTNNKLDIQNHQQLQSEAKTLAQLNHPNIVQIYDIIDDDQGLALVMEYVEGNTLNRETHERLVSLKQRLIWLQQIANGLAAAHEKGLIHRDLKADNILIDKNNIAKISDFGIAKNTLNEPDEYLQQDAFIGSYTALSPEQALGEPLDNRSDLFSFGILAFKLLCGCHPFGNTSNNNVLVQNILHQQSLPAQSLNSDLHDGLVNFLDCLLMKNRNNRPQNAAVVSQELQQYIDYYENNEIEEPNILETKYIGDAQYSAENLYASNKSQFTTSQHTGFSRINYTNATQIDKEGPIKKGFFTHKKVIVFFMFLLSFASVGGAYWYKQQNDILNNLYVAVLPPVINGNSEMSEERKKLLIETFNSALQQQVISTSGLHLISPYQVENTQGDYAQKAKALAADVLVESILKCEQERCQIELNRIESINDNNVLTTNVTERWAVNTQENWPMIIDMQYISTATEIKQRLNRLFPHHTNINKNHLLSETAYQEYLYYRHKVFNQRQYTPELWQELVQSQARYQNYLPYYQLISLAGRLLYDNTNDQVYIDELSTLLTVGEQSFGLNNEILKEQFLVALIEYSFDEAERLLLKMANQESDKVELLINKGRLLNLRGNYEQANTYYQQALTLRTSSELLFFIANNYNDQGNTSSALLTLDRLFTLKPNDHLALELQAYVYMIDGQLPAAISLYKKLINNNPQSLHYSNLGLAYELQGDFKQAELSFRNAVTTNPNHSISLLNLADSLQLQGKKEEAAKYYQQVIINSQSFSDDWSSQLNIALAEIQLGNTAKSLQALHRSIRLAGDNAEVLFNAAVIYSIAEQWLVALSYVEQSTLLDYNSIWFELPWFDGLCKVQGDNFNRLLVASQKNKAEKESRLRCLN